MTGVVVSKGELPDACPLPVERRGSAATVDGRNRQSDEEIDVRHVRIARRLYDERRRRDAAMQDHGVLFGEPCWDILLDMFISLDEGKSISVSSACLSAGVPQSTALRYVGELERVGFLSRSTDPLDARRRYLTLTELGVRTMRDYLTGLE